MTGRFTAITTDASGNITLEIPARNFVISSSEPSGISISPITDFITQQIPSSISIHTVDLQAPFNDKWGNPTYIDARGDAAEAPHDLLNLYASYDSENLSFALVFDNIYDANYGAIDYCIAIDTGSGGCTDDPGLHSNIKWGGLTNKPNIIIYVHTNQDSYKRYIQGISIYRWSDSQWQEGSISITAKMDPLIGDIELQLPLRDIVSGDTIALKGFATPANSSTVKDSVPQDNTIKSPEDEISWLFMPDVLNIDVASSSSTTPTVATPLLGMIFALPIIQTIRKWITQ